MTAENATQSALHSLLDLYDELAQTVKSDKLAEVANNSAIAKKVAKSLLLSQETQKSPERLATTVHIEKKGFFSGLWNSVGSFFGFTPKKDYSFVNNFQAISKQFAAIDIEELKKIVKDPNELQLNLEQLDKLKSVVNALASREGEGKYEKITRSISSELIRSEECHSYVKKGEALLTTMDRYMVTMRQKHMRTARYDKANKNLRKILKECEDGITRVADWQNLKRRLDSAFKEVEPMLGQMSKPKPTRPSPPIPARKMATTPALRKAVLPSFDQRPPPLEIKPPQPPVRTDSLRKVQFPPAVYEKLAVLMHGVSNPDHEFLDALLNALESDKGMDWSRRFSSELFHAMSPTSDILTVEQLVKEIRSIQAGGGDLEKLEKIVFAIEQHPGFADVLNSTVERREVLQSEEYRYLKALAIKPEKQRTDGEKQLLKLPSVQARLQLCAGSKMPHKSDVTLLHALFRDLGSLGGKLVEANAVVKQAKAFAELKIVLKEMGHLPQTLLDPSIQSVEALQAHFQSVKIQLEKIYELKEHLRAISSLNGALTELKEQEKSLRDDPFFSQFCEKLMPSALPLMQEIGQRELFQDPCKHKAVSAPSFSDLEGLGKWVKVQRQVIDCYKMGLTDIAKLKNAFDTHLDPIQKQKILDSKMTKETLLQALLGTAPDWESQLTTLVRDGGWKTARQGSEYVNFWESLQADLAFSRGSLQTGSTKGYWSSIVHAQEALQQFLPEKGEVSLLQKYYLDRYAEALSKLAQSFCQAIEVYDHVWDQLMQFQVSKNGLPKDKVLYSDFSRQEKECRSLLQNELNVLSRTVGTMNVPSFQTQQLLSLQEKFSSYMKRTVELSKKGEYEQIIGMSILANPPRLSTATEFLGLRNDAFGPQQDTLMQKLEATLQKREAVSLEDAMKRRISEINIGKHEEPDEDEW